MIWISSVSKNPKHLIIKSLLRFNLFLTIMTISGMLDRDLDMQARLSFTKRNSDPYQETTLLSDMICSMMMGGLQKLLSTNSRSSTDISQTDDPELMAQRCSVINSIFTIRSSDMYNLSKHKVFKL